MQSTDWMARLETSALQVHRCLAQGQNMRSILVCSGFILQFAVGPKQHKVCFSHDLQVSVTFRCPCCRAALSVIRHPPAQGLPAATLELKHTVSSRDLQLPNQLHRLRFTSGVMSATLSTHA